MRRLAGDTGDPWQEPGRRPCTASELDMPRRSCDIPSLHLNVDEPRLRKPLVTLKPISGLSVKDQTQKSQKVTGSSLELRLTQKYMHQALPSEGIDNVASRKPVNGKKLIKLARRVELENEVVELHHQLEQEVELHNTLKNALSDSSSAQLPDSVLHDLPNNVQRLLTDIAMLEATVLDLESQASALQWDLGRERTERKGIEYTLNAPLNASLKPRYEDSSAASLPSRSAPAPSAKSPVRSAKSPLRVAKSPTLATLKELLHEPTPEREQSLAPPSKSPRKSLRSLWSALEDRPPTSFLPNSKNVPTLQRSLQQSAVETTTTTTYFPSTAAVAPRTSHISPPLSPSTPADQPRNITPITPAREQDGVPRKSMNPARLLVSTKRLAFLNSSNTSDAESLNNRSANPTPEFEQPTDSSPHDYSPILDEDFTDHVKMPKLRRSRGMKRQDQSLLSPLDDARWASNFSESEVVLASPRKSIKDSPRPTAAAEVDGLFSELLSDPNRLSEEMVRCMVDIYCHLAEPSGESNFFPECPLSPCSHTGRLSTSSSYSSQSDSSLPSGAYSPEMDPVQYGDVMGSVSTLDPYKAMGKLPWANIGPYTDAFEVPWLSVGKDQLEYVAHSLGKFRLLVERLTNVDPSTMKHEQKLAFWINLYNALLMHAFLAYGIPRSDLKFFTLMQKAAYCVGGHWFNAAAIECNLLKAKIMLHRPQFALIVALHNKKLTEEQRQFGIDRAEPKVNFALSCGGHSSPMVRIYTPEHIHDELDCAFQDYVRATVGITAKGGVLLPKLVYNYAREFVQDDMVLEWACRFLPIAQVTVIYECIQQRSRRLLLNPATFSVVPYSFAFRYLFQKAISGAASNAGDFDFAPKDNSRHRFCT